MMPRENACGGWGRGGGALRSPPRGAAGWAPARSPGWGGVGWGGGPAQVEPAGGGAGAKAWRGAPIRQPPEVGWDPPPPGRCRFPVSLSWGRPCLRSLLGLESRPGFRQRVPPARPLPGRLSPCAALCIASRPCPPPRRRAGGAGKFGLPRKSSASSQPGLGRCEVWEASGRAQPSGRPSPATGVSGGKGPPHEAAKIAAFHAVRGFPRSLSARAAARRAAQRNGRPGSARRRG